MLYDEERTKNIEILTLPDLMSYLAIGKSTAYNLLKSGKIRSFRIGRNYKIPMKSVLEFVERSNG